MGWTLDTPVCFESKESSFLCLVQLWSPLESFCYQHMLWLIFPLVGKQTQLNAHFVQVGNMGFWPKVCLDIVQFMNSVIVRCSSPKSQEEAHVLLYVTPWL